MCIAVGKLQRCQMLSNSTQHGGKRATAVSKTPYARVVRRLAHVDVVVRVDGLLRALDAAQDLDGAVGNDLRRAR